MEVYISRLKVPLQWGRSVKVKWSLILFPKKGAEFSARAAKAKQPYPAAKWSQPVTDCPDWAMGARTVPATAGALSPLRVDILLAISRSEKDLATTWPMRLLTALGVHPMVSAISV